MVNVFVLLFENKPGAAPVAAVALSGLASPRTGANVVGTALAEWLIAGSLGAGESALGCLEPSRGGLTIGGSPEDLEDTLTEEFPLLLPDLWSGKPCPFSGEILVVLLLGLLDSLEGWVVVECRPRWAWSGGL